MAAQSSSVQAGLDHEEAHHPYSRAYDIFLSHSGKERAFVENLYDALMRANHTAFFDKHTLPKGSPFPPHIFRAVDGCKLCVVVLSHDFLTSKWPMIELERLILQKYKKDPHAIVLPLFYKLRPEDLKSQKNLSKWRCVWEEKAGRHAKRWEEAVKALGSFNGVVFAQETSEAAYIKTVVRLICKLVPRYDLSHIQGHQRFSQEVADQCDNRRMVGLYGVGGLGKTTMCKIMCNYYNSHYLGKSCYIEFPSDGDDKTIALECMKALKKLANLSDEHLVNKSDSFDQVIQLMRQNLRQHDLFLAIDNVWESSLEAAKRILGVSFSHNSKILLTSRSEEVLKDLIRGHSNTIVGPLPSPDQQECFQIFQDSLELGDLNSLVNRNLLDSVLKRCSFSGKYHVLVLKALGRYVKRACVLEGFDKIEHLQGIDNSTALQNVEDLIRLSYVNLAAEKKHMFLDIVVVVMAAASSNNVEVTYRKAQQWLSVLYKKYNKSTITNLIYELALDGLIQLENMDDKSAEKIIRVHDLYLDLAKREAAISARFFTDGSAMSVEEIRWERLERVVLWKHHEKSRFIEEIQQKECRKLQVLCARNVEFRSGIKLDLMPSLCVLKLERGTLRSIKDWSAATELAIVHLSDLKCARPLKPIPSLPCLEELIIENVKTVEGPPNLDGCQRLKRLVLNEASVFKEGEEASYFNSLKSLESLEIRHFSSTTRVNALVNLQLLDIGSCESIERIEGLDALKNLQRLHVGWCPYLSNLDGLSGLLQLAVVYVGNCEALQRMPDLSGLTRLERLRLSGNGSMKEVVVGGFSPALKHVEVSECGALKAIPDLSGLTRLERLRLSDNESMEEVRGENLSSTLQDLDVSHCRRLRRFPRLNECVHLQNLTASACVINTNINTGSFITERLVLIDGEWASIERLIISGSFLENLQELCVRGGEWTSIEHLIRGVPHLQSLDISECDSLVKLDVGCLLSNLKELQVRGCIAVEEIGDLSALHSLETLTVSYCPKLKKLGGFSTPHLRSLTLQTCESLEESTVPDVSLIPEVSIKQCRSFWRNLQMEGVFTKAPGLQRDYPDLTGERKGHVRISHDKSCEEFARCLAAELQKMSYNAIIVSPDSLGAESKQIKDQILHHSSLGLFVLSDSFFRNEGCLSDVVDFCQKTQVPKLSLFYKLSKFEFKDEKGRELWRETWRYWKEGNDNMANWEQAAELLGSWDGIEYSTQASNIMHYVQTVAEAVCHCVPLQVYWSKESSQVQGKKPMCEKVDALFESKASLINGGTQVLGVHGIWGVGKSTLGKVLLDFYSPEFGGRVCYMQLGPTPLPDSYGVRLHRQKRILLELFEASATFVDSCVRDLGQANAYLDYCLGQAFKKVFLVVDNIQDSMQSFEEAGDLFMRKVPFPRGSKVLLLARSPHTLRRLLQPLENLSSDTVVQFPSHLLFDGCDQIFHQALESGLAKSAVETLYKECDKDDIFQYFFPAYCRSRHPLTIKSLAAFAQSRGSVFGGVPQFQSKHANLHQEKPLPTTIAWENNVKICILIKNEGLLENVFETLQKGYKLLNSKEQQFFLDVALYMPSTNIHRLRRLHDSSDELFSTTSKCLRKLRDEAFLIYKGREVHMPAVCRCFADQMVQRDLSAQMMHIARETVQLALIHNNFVKASHFDSLQRIAFESCHFVQGDNFASNYFFLDLSGCKLLSLLRLWGNRSEKMIEVLLGTCYMLKSLEIQCNTSPIVVTGDCRYVECFKGDYSTRVVLGAF